MNKPDLEILKKYEPIYVIGHSHIDVDSAVSSKIFSSILNFFGIKSYYAILDNNYDFDEFNKKILNDCMYFDPIIINQKDINNHNYHHTQVYLLILYHFYEILMTFQKTNHLKKP